VQTPGKAGRLAYFNGERQTFKDRFTCGFWRALFRMRKRIELVAGLVLALMTILLASCQSEGAKGNSNSKENVTDPNTSFSNPATRQ
jgi:hypothetical protein